MKFNLKLALSLVLLKYKPKDLEIEDYIKKIKLLILTTKQQKNNEKQLLEKITIFKTLNNSNLGKELDYLELNSSLKGNFTKSVKTLYFEQFLDIRIGQEPITKSFTRVIVPNLSIDSINPGGNILKFQNLEKNLKESIVKNLKSGMYTYFPRLIKEIKSIQYLTENGFKLNCYSLSYFIECFTDIYELFELQIEPEITSIININLSELLDLIYNREDIIAIRSENYNSHSLNNMIYFSQLSTLIVNLSCELEISSVLFLITEVLTKLDDLLKKFDLECFNDSMLEEYPVYENIIEGTNNYSVKIVFLMDTFNYFLVILEKLLLIPGVIKEIHISTSFEAFTNVIPLGNTIIWIIEKVALKCVNHRSFNTCWSIRQFVLSSQ
ncbi:hypothetical protein CONCODRAFT_4228 [Conidiobolus coronatus NRRL 28638]|uniref:Uncharacterized protein n=1 Tax=Conidiobolus coronatus (strain ATCC 28846 / CBS 209.66 / NRRL 28638) TaxID=796925 RepID=A0A137PD69_CONC2|nr:hypothetical protein CONCODRAFT_4228 [Conidiobolus coronatus NRRL 28638]|eukprot:KXN72948.1 hypothetical protein CONCODRAFT_4228 [Conidiobolus coronatus NRRL 28638]